MTFTVDSYTLNVVEFSESSEPVGSEWHAWESEKIVIRRYVYGVKRVWRISCVEKDVAWSSSVAKYLQGKMAAGETVSFEVDEGERYQLQSVQAYIASLELEIPQTGAQSIRRYTVTLKEK